MRSPYSVKNNKKDLQIKQQGLFINKKYTTPGWSSVQENNQHTSKSHSQSNILNKIKSSKHIDLQKAQFKNIKTHINFPENGRFNFNQIKNNENQKTHQRQKHLSDRQSKTNYNIQNQHKTTYGCSSTQISYHGSIIRNYSKTPVKRYQENTQSWIRKITPTKDCSPIRPIQRVRQNENLKKQNSSSGNRFKQITVHDYLYLQSKRKQTKKIVEKIIQEEYSKQKFRFCPIINERSLFLAKSKYEKEKQSSKITSQFQIQNETIQKEKNQSSHNKLDIFQEKQNQEKNKYEILNDTFYFLSNQTRKITKNKLSQKLIQLPIPCVKVLQPLIQELYKNKQKQISWTQFLSNFNSKCKNKQSFLVLMKKFFDKIKQNSLKNEEDKDNSQVLQVSKFYQQNL